MTLIENVIQDCIKDLENSNLSTSTKIRNKEWFSSFRTFTIRNHYFEPSQKLYDDYLIYRSSFSEETQAGARYVIRKIDEKAGTHSISQEGFLLNEEPFPSIEETTLYFQPLSFPCTKSLKLRYLISLSLEKIKETGISISTLGQYRRAYRFIFAWMYSVNGIDNFDKNLLQKFLIENDEKFLEGNVLDWVRKIRRRAVLIMLEIAETGNFQWKLFHKSEKDLSDELEILKSNYISSISSSNLSKSTLDLHAYVFSKFCMILYLKDKDDIYSLEIEDIVKLTDTFSSTFNGNSLSTVYPILRKVLDFLYDEKILKRKLSGIIMNPNYFKGHDPSFLSKEDEIKILENLHLLSLRDQAMILLAVRYGLRESDIIGLRFEEIDWEHDQIRITQKKTKEPVTLPLFDDVGNTILSYIEEERPKIPSSFIFIKSTKPYAPVGSMYHIVSRFLTRIGIEPSQGKIKGSHLFRYSLTKRLLEIKVPHQIITDTLGHSSKDSDKYYYSLEDEMLRKCCLDARWIGVKSWK